MTSCIHEEHIGAEFSPCRSASSSSPTSCQKPPCSSESDRTRCADAVSVQHVAERPSRGVSLHIISSFRLFVCVVPTADSCGTGYAQGVWGGVLINSQRKKGYYQDKPGCPSIGDSRGREIEGIEGPRRGVDASRAQERARYRAARIVCIHRRAWATGDASETAARQVRDEWT
jgi:hypothetical protein